MRILLLLLGLLLAIPAPPAAALDLPGLSNDAEAWSRQLTRRYPAGATAQQKAQAEQRATQAERAGNWAAAAQAWEDRVAGGDPKPEHWLALGRAMLRRTPPEPARALQAAWMNYQMVPAGAPEIPSLQVMAEALARLDRPAQQIQVLQEIVERAPNDQAARTRLTEARRAAGLLVARINTEADAEPARACLSFTVAPSRRDDWQPQDWVRAEPAIPGLAVTKEGDSLCIVGLPHGRRTAITLRAGMPGEDGLRVNRDLTLNIAMPNRAPRIAFDAATFLLPRGQEPRVTVATVNISTLNLRVVQVTERNLLPFGRDWRVGEAIDAWTADTIPDEWGRVIWEGTAQLPRFEGNRTQRTPLPLPDALRGAGPGLFVLVAKAGDGSRARAAALPLLATDMGLTAWRSPRGLAVQARSLAHGRPLAGATLRLMATNNDILAEAMTGADGLARFSGPLLAGTGPMAPKAVQGFLNDDLVQLDLDAAAFDLSDRGAGGLPHPGPLDAFVWLDRGIYRPGEVVQASALLRDGGGAPAEFPARLRVRRPNGQVFAENVPPRQQGSAVFWPVQLSSGAQAGVWTLEVLSDPQAPPIGRAEFRVDAFVPERLEVTAGPAPGPLVAGATLNLPIAARFLYGAPAAGLTGTAELRLTPNRSPFADRPGMVFGLVDETAAPDLQGFEIGALNAEGRGTLALRLSRLPDLTRPLTGELTVTIDEPGGRASRTTLSIPVRAQERLIGLRPLFDQAVDVNAEAGFEIVALDADAKPVAATLRARLVRERPDWRFVTAGGTARYETVWRDEAVDSAEIQVTPDAPARFARSLPFGRYRLEVSQPGTLAITSIRFRSGWAAGATAEVPDKVDVAADRQRYTPGETARLRISPPFAGPASVAVLTDRLLTLREVDVPAGGAEVEIPVDASWGAGAYVAVTVFRPGEAARGAPSRALGLAWLQVDPASRRIDVAIGTPERILPRQRLAVPLRLSTPDGAPQGAMLTLAAVDEGILRLTNFRTPDPLTHFTGKRQLGVDIRDDYGRLIPPAEGEAAALRQGGDGMDSTGTLQIPQRIVALFSGPVQVAADGTATVELDIPDFAGELRLMAVAWAGTRTGAAAKPLTVRDPVVAEALLPRFLAPGDDIRVPVLLHNLDLPPGEVVATLRADGALGMAGPTRLAATLATGARAQPVTIVQGNASGEGVLRLAVTGPQNFRAEREYRITIRSSRPEVTEAVAAEFPNDAEVPVAPPVERFLPGSWRASLSVGGVTRYDSTAMLRLLEDYPFACLEQSASRLLALATARPTPQRAGLMQEVTETVLNRQRFDGAFGLWSAQGQPEPWLTPYAVEALLRARAAGATVPEAALEEALKFLAEAIEDAGLDTPEGRAAQAYRLYALSLANRHRLGAARRLMEMLDRVPTPLAKAQLGAAFARAGDRERAEAAFAAALAAPERRWWNDDFGSAARDALAVALLLKESGLLTDRLPQLIARLPGPELTPQGASTQEQAWAVAAAQVLGRDGQPVTVSLNGQPWGGPPAELIALPLAGSVTVKNLSGRTTWRSVSITGIPREALPAGNQGLRVNRRFFTLNGQGFDVSSPRQNSSFIMLLEGRAETREAHRVLLQQGLPAGWEVVSRLGPGPVPGMAWLGELSTPAATPAADDRYAAAVDLTPEEPNFRLAVRIRAVTIGRYELPGAELVDMYRPAIFARQATRRVAVAPPE